MVLTSSSFCRLSTNQIRPPGEGQFDPILGNQIGCVLQMLSFFLSHRHIPERLARVCNGIGHLLSPHTVTEHQLYEWIVNKEVTVQIDAKIQGGSWYMVGAHYILE